MAATLAHPETLPQYVPAGPNDLRSPCPALNAMANHGILPHDGRGLTASMLIKATEATYHTDHTLSKMFSLGGKMSSLHILFSSTFNLDDLAREKTLRHDGLLARPDFSKATEHHNNFDQETWNSFLDCFHGVEETTIPLAASARLSRIEAAAAQAEASRKKLYYGSIQYVLSYGEMALSLSVFGDHETGKAKICYLDAWFGKERLPYDEGWRPHARSVTGSDLTRLMGKLRRASSVDKTMPLFVKWISPVKSGPTHRA